MNVPILEEPRSPLVRARQEEGDSNPSLHPDDIRDQRLEELTLKHYEKIVKEPVSHPKMREMLTLKKNITQEIIEDLA